MDFKTSDLEPTGSQHCDSAKGSHDVPHFSGDVTKGGLDPDNELRQEPDLLQKQSSLPESGPEPEPELLLLLLPRITHLLLNDDSREHQCRCYF